MSQGLETGFLLDRQWFLLRGEMEQSKRPALLALAKIFAEAGVPYAIIDGVALLESTPALLEELTAAERALLDQLPQ